MAHEERPAVPPWARILLTLAAVVIIVAGLRAAASILVPFFIAVFVSVIASGPLIWLERKRVPATLAVVLVVLGILGLGIGIGTMVGTSLNDFALKLPEYQDQLEIMRDEVLAFLQTKGVDLPADSLTTLVDPRSAMALTANLLKGIGGILANTLLIILTVVFILLEIATFTRKLRAAFGNPDAPYGGLDRFTDSVRRYMAIKTAISLTNGIVVTLWLLILGVDFALLWGLLTFLLNYVPNIGSLIALFPALLVALIQHGLGTAVLVALGYMVTDFILGSLIEPRFMGRGLGVSPLVIFISLVFWGWVFGPVGMLLSVPLTVTLKIALESNEETRWLSILMGGDEDATIPAATPAAAGKQGASIPPG